MNITKIIMSLEPKQQTFINRKSNLTLQNHLSTIRSIAHHMTNRKFRINKISPSIYTNKCGALITRVK
jgi:hypothetical protein